MVRINLRVPDELYERMQDEIEESTTIENDSQYVRAALREFQQQGEGEFDRAR